MMQESGEYEAINKKLKDRLLQYLPFPQILPTAIDGMYLARREDSENPEICFEKPLAGLVVQGVKKSFLAGKEYTYSENDLIITGIEMPIYSYAVNPTPENPFLFIYIYLDNSLISNLLIDMNCEVIEQGNSESSLEISKAPLDIIEMFYRLLCLLDKPRQLKIRSAMMLKELHYLLIMNESRNVIKSFTSTGTINNEILKATHKIKNNIAYKIDIDRIAYESCMSKTSFHRKFKEFTGLSPLQYLKQLRLHEARRLILTENVSISQAAEQVGYESVSQFNREYKRLFKSPPKQKF